MKRDATFSDDRFYRYSLTRVWDDANRSRACWVMLNPSTADHEVDDPTIRRVIDFSRRLGFGSCEVVNLWAWRATSPVNLLKAYEPRGPGNFKAINLAISRSNLAIMAWGANVSTMMKAGHPRLVPESIAERLNVPSVCLGHTKAGYPRHPLYVRGDTEPVSYRGATAT